MPLSASRTWGTFAIFTECVITDAVGNVRLRTDEHTVAVRLTRRDDPTLAVVVVVPEAWLRDFSVDIWSRVRRRASATWGWRTRRRRQEAS